jgi:hypothetical protein
MGFLTQGLQFVLIVIVGGVTTLFSFTIHVFSHFVLREKCGP